MPNPYERRFTQEEFIDKLFEHLRDLPPGHMQAPAKIRANVEWKAGYYASALAALDEAAARVRNIAASHPDPQMRTEAETAVQEINTAIDAYGAASMSGNSTWTGGGGGG